MLIDEMATHASKQAAPELARALLRIYLADASRNNGMVNGESVLCRAHSAEARAALEMAGVPLPAWAQS